MKILQTTSSPHPHCLTCYTSVNKSSKLFQSFVKGDVSKQDRELRKGVAFFIRIINHFNELAYSTGKVPRYSNGELVRNRFPMYYFLNSFLHSQVDVDDRSFIPFDPKQVLTTIVPFDVDDHRSYSYSKLYYETKSGSRELPSRVAAGVLLLYTIISRMI